MPLMISSGRKICYLIAIAIIASFAIRTPAQSTFNVNISDAGSGKSLISWFWTGDVAGSTGATWNIFSLSFGGFDIAFGDAFASGSPLLTQGTNFDISGAGMYVNTDANQAGQISLLNLGLITYPGNYKRLSILLMTVSGVPVAAGEHLAYVTGNDSMVIPVDFSNFNVGIYQNTFPGPFTTSVTDILTVGPVPEPSSLGLVGLGVLALFLCRRLRK